MPDHTRIVSALNEDTSLDRYSLTKQCGSLLAYAVMGKPHGRNLERNVEQSGDGNIESKLNYKGNGKVNHNFLAVFQLYSFFVTMDEAVL